MCVSYHMFRMQDPNPVDVYATEYMIDGNQMAIVGEQ